MWFSGIIPAIVFMQHKKAAYSAARAKDSILLRRPYPLIRSVPSPVAHYGTAQAATLK